MNSIEPGCLKAPRERETPSARTVKESVRVQERHTAERSTTEQYRSRRIREADPCVQVCEASGSKSQRSRAPPFDSQLSAVQAPEPYPPEPYPSDPYPPPAHGAIQHCPDLYLELVQNGQLVIHRRGKVG